MIEKAIGQIKNVRSNISIKEQQIFIEKVMLEALRGSGYLLWINADISFYKNYLLTFTDFKTPFDEIEDRETQMMIVEVLSLDAFAMHLKNYINNQVALLIQKNEAVETVAYLANKTLDGINKICDILDNIKDLSQDGKFLKVIPKSKINAIFEGIQKIIESLIHGSKQPTTLEGWSFGHGTGSPD